LQSVKYFEARGEWQKVLGTAHMISADRCVQKNVEHQRQWEAILANIKDKINTLTPAPKEA
jgi:hypothetical protein